MRIVFSLIIAILLVWFVLMALGIPVNTTKQFNRKTNELQKQLEEEDEEKNE